VGCALYYTQSLAIGAPYPYFALAGTSTLLTYHAATTHSLYSRGVAIASPRHWAPIEYNHSLFCARVGRAVASQSGRLSSVAEHGKREMRSYPPQVLQMTLKQTLVHSPGPNGRPAASRASTAAWRGCLAGVVIMSASTSKRAKLRPRATVDQRARLLLPQRCSAMWRCRGLRFAVDQSRGHEPLHETKAGRGTG
jgi:hypothetical protein